MYLPSASNQDCYVALLVEKCTPGLDREAEASLQPPGATPRVDGLDDAGVDSVHRLKAYDLDLVPAANLTGDLDHPSCGIRIVEALVPVDAGDDRIGLQGSQS